MSFIIPCNNPFLNIKLTNIGRSQLAKGNLTFSNYALGNSEVNFSREQIVANSTDAYVSIPSFFLKPKDENPDIKYFVSAVDTTINNASPLLPLSNSNIKSTKIQVSNIAEERGLYSHSVNTYTPLLSSPLVLSNGTIPSTYLSGGTNLYFTAATTYAIGSFVCLRVANSKSGAISLSGTSAIPVLWYQIQSSASTSHVTVDRGLPIITGTSTPVQYIIYNVGDIYSIFGSDSSAYWNTNTLSFDSSCSTSVLDVPIWNQSLIYARNPIGVDTSSAYTSSEDYTYYDSFRYFGELNYLGYNQNLTANTSSFSCNGTSGLDNYQKAVAILHYTNQTISNFYGEYFYIDTTNNKTVQVYFPSLLYHRIDYVSSGITAGMNFIASGSSQSISTNGNISYIPLIEDPTLVTNLTPRQVGKVFPELKIVVIEDEELISTMSYKSSRNWTLPSLTATLVSPTGTTSGVLAQNSVMYLTYVLRPSDPVVGVNNSMPCQYVTKIINSTNSAKDIAFTIESLGLLPYLRKIENNWDGLGFSAYKFHVLSQIVSDPSILPDPGLWKEVDFTTTAITDVAGQSINPSKLQIQNPNTNGFFLTKANTSGATNFDLINLLSLPLKVNPTYLNFGSEKFGNFNISSYIGATIYKTLFDIRLNASQFKYTTNPTFAAGDDLIVSEIGIYDASDNLVIIGKLSQPITITSNGTIMVELGLDF